MEKRKQIPDHNAHMSQSNMPLLFETPFSVIISFTLLVKRFTRFWSKVVDSCVHSTTRVLIRSDSDVRQRVLGFSQYSASSQSCSVSLRSGLCVGPSPSSIPSLDNHAVFMENVQSMNSFESLLPSEGKYNDVRKQSAYFQLHGNRLWKAPRTGLMSEDFCSFNVG